MSAQWAFTAYTIMSIINLIIIIMEARESPAIKTTMKGISEFALHLIVAYTYYVEWRKEDEEDKSD